MTESPYIWLALAAAFIVLGLALFDDAVSRVLMIAAGLMFALEFARRQRSD